MDVGLLGPESTESYCYQVQEMACGSLFWYSCAPYLFLHSAQGPQSSWRYDVETPTRGTLLMIAAYTIYAFFEWALILFDVGFDAITMYDFSSFEIVVRDVKGLSRGYVHRLPR